VLTSYIIIQGRLESWSFRIGFLILYSLSLLFKIGATSVVSYIDPSDPLMKLSRAPESPHRNQQIAALKDELSLFCSECMSFVKRRSKHCKRCERCVEEFDHHCVWVNNCIGIKNYSWFMLMLWAVQF
jgi:palmitoyltransferase